jgi:hypothetical protein
MVNLRFSQDGLSGDDGFQVAEHDDRASPVMSSHVLKKRVHSLDHSAPAFSMGERVDKIDTFPLV